MTNIDRVLDLIQQHPEGLDDDEITELSGIQPRQQIYQICTRLTAEGRIRRVSLRKPGKRRKLHNLPLDATYQKGAQVDHDSPSEPLTNWRRRLSMLIAATGRSEEELLDEALRDLALRLLREETAE